MFLARKDSLLIYFNIENLKEAPKVLAGEEIMQGLAATATTDSLIFLAPRFRFLLFLSSLPLRHHNQPMFTVP